MAERTFAPGCRFSRLDAATLLVGAGVAAGFALLDIRIGVAIAFVVAHFFLFCNIVRMARPLELIWAAAFATLAVLATLEWIHWAAAIAISSGVTIVLTGIQMRRPSYHGVGWRTINPDLYDWWQKHRNA